MLPAVGSALTFSEIMYHPMPFMADDGAGGESLEYIELYNEGPEVEDLTGYSIRDGVEFEFPEGTLLGANEFLVIARDPVALTRFCDFLEVDPAAIQILGPWTGSLDNAGDLIELRVEGGGRLLRMEYRDDGLWPAAADGTGHSIELLNPYSDVNEPENWDASDLIGGTPGQAGGFLTPGFDEGTSSPDAWTRLEFDDSEWYYGMMPLGRDRMGRYPIVTELTDMLYTYSTVYVRLPFEAEFTGELQNLELDVFFDDAFVAYINGVEVYRSKTAGGTPGLSLPYNATSGNILPELDDYATFDITEHMDLIEPGANMLAIHALNMTISSSDFIISARLRGAGPSGETEFIGDNAYAQFFKGVREPVDLEGPGLNHLMGRKKSPDIVINEFMAATSMPDQGDWLELYNRGKRNIRVGGWWISDDADRLLGIGAFRIPAGTLLEPGEFILFSRAELGFGFSSLGEKIFLTSTDGSHVIDAVEFGEMTKADHSFGRYPDGSDLWVTMSDPSPGNPAVFEKEDRIVFNEIMYHPPGDRDEEEYIELYNRSGDVVDLGGWRLSKGISFEFPSGTSIDPGAYLVVAKDPEFMASRYGLTNVTGPFSGVLSNSGEMVRLRDALRNTVDEVRYFDGGDWPEKADGGGSSLELIDPRDENDTAAAWAASDESGKSEWVHFEHTAVLKYWWGSPESELHLLAPGRAEMLLDGISVRKGSSELIPNGSFENGTSGWKIEGTLIDSSVTSLDSTDGGHSLRLVSSGRGDTAANRMEIDTLQTMNYGSSYTISGEARWLSGDPLLFVRTHQQGIGFSVTLPVPDRLGSPGRVNGAYRPNRGPAVTSVLHHPAVPREGEPVTVSATVSDVDGIDTVQLLYRLDGIDSEFRAPLTMHPTGDLERAVFRGFIPAQPSDRLVAFRVVAYDQSGESGSYPDADAGWDCLYWVGGKQWSQFGRYRILLPEATARQLSSRPKMSNHLLPCAFVFNDSEVYYNSRIRLRGSPFTRSQISPVSSKRALRIRFPAEKPFLGRSEINLDTMETSRNPSLQSERIAYWIARKTGVPWSSTRFARVQINQNDHGLYGDIQKVDSDFLSFWFPDEDEGYLYKTDDWFEFTDSGGRMNRDADLFLWAGGNTGNWGDIKELYRWNYRPRTRETEDNFKPLMNLISAANSPDPGYIERMTAVLDIDEALNEFAMQHIVGNWDTWGYNRGKNALIYQRPSDGRFVVIPWDIDFVMGSGAQPWESLTNAGLYGFSRFYQAFGERYEKICRDIARNVLGSEDLRDYIDRTYEVLKQENVGVTDPAPVKEFIEERRSFILGPPLTITTNSGADLITQDQNVTISGSAPYGTSRFEVNGESVAVTWDTATSWSMSLFLPYGSHALRIDGLDQDDDILGSDDLVVTVQPFVMKQLIPADLGLTIGWNAIPGRQYDVWAQNPDGKTARLAAGITANKNEMTYLDRDAWIYPARFYWVSKKPLDWMPGLIGSYYQGVFNQLLEQKIDSRVLFNWGSDSPGPGIPADQFSVRWQGYVKILYPGSYTFWTNSDDGVRLRVDGQLAIDNWTDHGPTWDQGTVDIPAGYVPIELEYYENGGGAVIELEFEGRGTPRQTIPSDRLFHKEF
jgi:hypothetical protein